MNKKITALFLGLIFVAVGAAAAWGADQPLPEFKVEKAEVVLFDKLTVTASAALGLTETLAPEGRVLLMADLTLKPEWTEAIERAWIQPKEILLKTPDGAETPMLGYFERYGHFRMGGRSFSVYRRSDWKEKPRLERFNAVFLAPKGLAEAEMKLGELTIKLTVPGETKEQPVPADTVGVEIVKAEFVDDIESVQRVGDLKPKPSTLVSRERGLILALTIKLTPKMGNGDNPDHFFWFTSWFGVRADGGPLKPTFGEIFMDGLNDGVSHNLNRNSQGVWPGAEAVLFFAVPEGASTFSLAYLGTPAAEVKLEPPAPKEKDAAGEEEAPKEKAPEDKAKETIRNFMNQAD